jgi:hypothetical protein
MLHTMGEALGACTGHGEELAKWSNFDLNAQ